MAQIGKWSGHSFEISPSSIKSFNELRVKIGSNTDTKDQSGQQYMERKSFKPIEVSLTVRLHAGLGYDVRQEAEAFAATALRGGEADYFYVGDSKLVSCRLMLTEATISQVMINAGGIWTAAEIALVLQQAALLDGTQTGGESYSAAPGSQKQTVAPTRESSGKTVSSALPDGTKKAVKNATDSIKSMVKTAKTVSGGGSGANKPATALTR